MVAYDRADVTTVVGGPESLLDLAAAGQLGSAPTVLAGDASTADVAGPVAMTDGLRRRDVSFGGLRDNTSQTLTADDTFEVTAPAHDYLPEWGAEHSTVARFEGIDAIRTSTARSQVGSPGGARPEHRGADVKPAERPRGAAVVVRQRLGRLGLPRLLLRLL